MPSCGATGVMTMHKFVTVHFCSDQCTNPMYNAAAGTNTAGVVNQAHVGLDQSTVFGELAQQAAYSQSTCCIK
jgi:hypothetical protein